MTNLAARYLAHVKLLVSFWFRILGPKLARAWENKFFHKYFVNRNKQWAEDEKTRKLLMQDKRKQNMLAKWYRSERS